MSQLFEAQITLPVLADPQISPTGSRAAFVKGNSFKADKDSSATAAIFVVDTTSQQIRQFAGNDQTYSGSPRWSPDGSRLAFISDRANRRESQLYVMPVDGGEAVRLTDLRGRIRSPFWLPNSDALTFLSSGGLTALAVPDPVVQDAGNPFTRVWLTDAVTGNTRPLTPDNLNVYEYALSADGACLALIAATEASNEAWYYAQVYLADIATGIVRQVCQTSDQIGRPVFSPDGTQIAFICDVLSDEGAVAGDVYVVPAAGGSPRLLTPNLDHSPVWLTWTAEGILYGARQQTGSRLGLIDPLSGTVRTIVSRPDSIAGRREQPISIARDGDRFVTLIDGFEAPPDLYLGSLNTGKLTQLTSLVPALPAQPTLVESITWDSTDGTSVQGYFSYPAQVQPGKRYPLIVIPHGGPSASHEPSYGGSAWGAWKQWATQHGCALLMPNPRGSWGRGHAFQAANVGDLGGGDWQDINSGIDHLIKQGLVDPDRLAIAGWSYGGYLTAWAITQTDRFKCAIAGAAITNNESNYGVVSIRGWQAALYGSTPYEQSELHRSRSPLSHVHKVHTPILLLHGEEDDDVPVGQSIEFYTALKHYKVTAECVIYPREPHGFQEKAHQIDLAERITGWLARYLNLPIDD